MKIRTLIVDDEPLARQRIRTLLQQTPDVEIVGEAADGMEALVALAALRPDLLFLDVQMPELDGFGVLAELDAEHAPAVVFVTAFDQYALRAFEVHALDYLLKPFEDARFHEALERVREHLADDDPALRERLARLLEELRTREPRYAERVVIRRGAQYVFQPVEEIDWVEADGNYVRLHVGAKTHLLRKTMAQMEAMLDPACFVRLHRSSIISLRRIRAIEPLFSGEYTVLLSDGTTLPTSRSYRSVVQALLSGAG